MKKFILLFLVLASFPTFAAVTTKCDELCQNSLRAQQFRSEVIKTISELKQQRIDLEKNITTLEDAQLVFKNYAGIKKQCTTETILTDKIIEKVQSKIIELSHNSRPMAWWVISDTLVNACNGKRFNAASDLLGTLKRLQWVDDTLASPDHLSLDDIWLQFFSLKRDADEQINAIENYLWVAKSLSILNPAEY
ncbi:MAG: hypothetical protein ACOYOK_01435 [Pseudobdellovibrionaceae bacterium]